MFFDLNVPVSTFIPTNPTQSQSKKGKGKQPQQPNVVSYTPAQISAIEARVTLLVHRKSNHHFLTIYTPIYY